MKKVIETVKGFQVKEYTKEGNSKCIHPEVYATELEAAKAADKKEAPKKEAPKKEDAKKAAPKKA